MDLIVVNVPGCTNLGREHRLVSVRTGSALLPFVERCGKCDWIDSDALTRAVEHAIKSSLSAQAGRIAVAVETEPFAFVQTSTEPLGLREILVQALAAAHAEGVKQNLNASDGKRLSSILRALEGEVGRAMRVAVQAAGEPDA